MSGGVDSSLAAALLVEQGFDVIGVSMRLWEGPDATAESGCCTLDDFLDARLVAEQLGIPFYVMDFRDEFRRRVVDDFVAEYGAGRTPNPCTRCNQFVKFGTFWQRARELGAEWIATGHYARRRDGSAGAELLARPRSRTRTSRISSSPSTAAYCEHTLFPIGDLDKGAVRRAAARRGLAVARKADSQEVCFAPRGTYAEFVAGQAGRTRPGAIVDAQGRVLARHDGVHRFTVGQTPRSRYRPGRPAALRRRDRRGQRRRAGRRRSRGAEPRPGRHGRDLARASAPGRGRRGSKDPLEV